MRRILRIYEMENKPNSTYGLFPAGYRYEVKDPFEIEILAG